MIDPTCGLMLQVTAVLLLPVTVGVNVAVWEAVRVEVVGFRDTATVGDRVMLAVAVLVESAELVAVTVMVWPEVMLDGAV